MLDFFALLVLAFSVLKCYFNFVASNCFFQPVELHERQFAKVGGRKMFFSTN